MNINATLNRSNYLSSGIFGKLTINDIPYYTAEHAYEQTDGTWKPKIAPGRYNCVKRWSEKHQIDLFWIDNVPDFMGSPVTACELHIGNFPQVDSDGCILLGKSIDLDCHTPGDIPMIGLSNQAFREFMILMDGTNEFPLVVS